MKAKLTLVLLAVMAGTPQLQAQTTAFTYQGRLTDGGNPAHGSYDLKFSLHDVATGGVTLAAIQGLNQKVEEQRTELRLKGTEIAELKQRLEKLEQLLASNAGTK